MRPCRPLQQSTPQRTHLALLGAFTLALAAAGCTQPSMAVTPEAQPDAGGAVPAPDGGAFDASIVEPPWTKGVWTLLARSPPPRSVHVMAFDPVHGQTLVLSGNHGEGPIGDMWSWDGQSWAKMAGPPGSAAERKNGGIAFDSRRGRLILHQGIWSGYRDGQYRTDTLSDAWSWDGTTWTALPSPRDLTPRAGHALAYDAARDRVVLFGGMSAEQEALADTWEFDGSSWVKRSVAQSPSARLNHRMSYDTDRHRVVLFGGQQVGPAGLPVNLDDTWEWDGSHWSRVPTATRPPGRGFFAFAYDGARKKTLLLGGMTTFPRTDLSGAIVDDFWEWDGSEWRQVSPSGPRPTLRTGASMVYDDQRARVVLFGGHSPSGELADVWEWNGTGWSERTPVPSGRSDSAIATRSGTPGPQALLVGGYVTAGGFFLEDTWVLESSQWHRVDSRGPPAREGARAAFHGSRGLMFGGAKPDRTGLLAETWLFDEPSGWRQALGTQPPGRAWHALAYDPTRDRTVLFGGAGPNGLLEDTWEWDGIRWQEVSPVLSPRPRKEHQLVFDANSGEVQLWGGIGPDKTRLDDVWTFNGTRWLKLSLPPVPGARVNAAMARSTGGRLLAFGGRSGGAVSNELWVHQAGGWDALPPSGAVVPAARFESTLVPDGEGLLMFGGSDSDFRTYWVDPSELWRLEPR